MGNPKKGNDKDGGEKPAQVSENGTGGRKASLDTLQNSVTDLQRKLDSHKSSQKQYNADTKKKVTHIKEINSQYTGLKGENQELRRELELLKAVVSKQYVEINELKHDPIDQKLRQMRSNVFFHQIPGDKNENCEKRIKDLVSTAGFSRDFAIDCAHRLERYDGTSNRPRPIVARLMSTSQVDSLVKFSQANKDKLKATPQFPTEIRARRKQLAEIAEAARNNGGDVKTKIVLDTLYINGERHSDDLPRPSARDILFMNDAEKKEAPETKFHELSKQVDGSNFIVRATKAQSINDCRTKYRMLLWNPENMAATHNTAAYRLFSPEGAITKDGYNDDGEHGMGKTVRDTLLQNDAKNLIVFVTSHYGGRHLGPKRFDIVKEMVKVLIEKVKGD